MDEAVHWYVRRAYHSAQYHRDSLRKNTLVDQARKSVDGLGETLRLLRLASHPDIQEELNAAQSILGNTLASGSDSKVVPFVYESLQRIENLLKQRNSLQRSA